MYAYTMVDIERGGQGPDGGIGIYIIGNHTKYTKYTCIPAYFPIMGMYTLYKGTLRYCNSNYTHKYASCQVYSYLPSKTYTYSHI